jgi:hypothetical protein
MTVAVAGSGLISSITTSIFTDEQDDLASISQKGLGNIEQKKTG